MLHKLPAELLFYSLILVHLFLFLFHFFIMKRDNSSNISKSLWRELPYYCVNLFSAHGEFNNTLGDHQPTKKYLESLTSVHDLDFFTLNTNSDINPDINLSDQRIYSRYYSPHSFNRLGSSYFNSDRNSAFSLLHNNIRSLKRNLDDFQTHILHELGYRLIVMGMTETRIFKCQFS